MCKDKDRHGPCDGSCKSKSRRVHMGNPQCSVEDVEDLGLEAVNQFDEIARPVGSLEHMKPDGLAPCPKKEKKSTWKPHWKPRKQSSVPPTIQHECFMKSFLPEHTGVKLVLLGSILIGTALQLQHSRSSLR